MMEISAEQLLKWLEAIDGVDYVLVLGKNQLRNAEKEERDELKADVDALERAYDEIESAWLDAVRERKTA